MGTKKLSTIPPRYGDPYYRGRGRGRGRREAMERMKGFVKGIQPEGLGEVMLEETLEGEIAEDTCPKIHSREMKGITRLESGWILQVKGEGRMILICIPLKPKSDTREIYHLQLPPHWKIDSEGSTSPCEGPPVQNVPIGETLLSHRTGDAYGVEWGQTTPQSSQPAAIPTITDAAIPNATGQAILIQPPSVRKLPDYLQRG